MLRCGLILVFITILSCTPKFITDQAYNTCKSIAINAKATFSISKSKKNCRLRIFVNKDNEIFFFLNSNLGLNIIKGRVDQKGITLINSIDKSYTKYSYSQLSKLMHIYLDYRLIQSLLLGKMHKSYPNLHSSTYYKENVYHYKVGKNFFVTYFDKAKDKIFYNHVYFLNTYNSLKVHYSYKNSEAFLYNSLIFYLCIKNKLELQEQEVFLEGVSYKLLDEKKSFDITIPKGYVSK
jgi:hypothetical protein